MGDFKRIAKFLLCLYQQHGPNFTFSSPVQVLLQSKVIFTWKFTQITSYGTIKSVTPVLYRKLFFFLTHDSITRQEHPKISYVGVVHITKKNPRKLR